LAPNPLRLVLLGVFGAAQGVRGEVRVKSFTANAKAIGAYGALTDKAGVLSFAFEALRPLRDDMLVARVKGVSTRDAAQALNGVEIYARRQQLPPPAEDEFYYDDLVGLAAVTRQGAPVGRVVALSDFGAGDILEIAPEGGGETLLLPFTKAVAPEIDFATGRIVVEPPAEIEGEPSE
jgi:16S rRNA processing protein RimM